MIVKVGRGCGQDFLVLYCEDWAHLPIMGVIPKMREGTNGLRAPCKSELWSYARTGEQVDLQVVITFFLIHKLDIISHG